MTIVKYIICINSNFNGRILNQDATKSDSWLRAKSGRLTCDMEASRLFVSIRKEFDNLSYPTTLECDPTNKGINNESKVAFKSITFGNVI